MSISAARPPSRRVSRGLSRRAGFRPAVDRLEPRHCPSGLYYGYDIVARTGQAGLDAIQPYTSINDRGDVAFVGSTAKGQGCTSGPGGARPG